MVEAKKGEEMVAKVVKTEVKEKVVEVKEAVRVEG